jgi:hypothetical protein
LDAAEIFSDEEFQILCWITQDRNVAQIAEEMHSGEEKVSKARARILELPIFPTTPDSPITPSAAASLPEILAHRL